MPAHHDEYFITLTITIVSMITTTSTIGITMYLIKYFMTDNDLEKLDSSTPRSPSISHITRSPSASRLQSVRRSSSIHSTQPDSSKINVYFKVTASVTLIFSAINALLNTVYCNYLLFDPAYDDKRFYVDHPSHIQRITSTVSWYIAKVSLIWFFTGRLYHAFKGSALRINGKVMLFINIFNTIFAPASLVVAYWSVYNQYLVVAEFAFNVWRIEYQIVVFIILIMFARRLLFLTAQEQSITVINGMACSPTIRDSCSGLENIENINMGSKNRMVFVMILARNAIVVLTISCTVALVTFCFFGFRWLYGEQTRLTLLIPMNMASFDSLITSICMVSLFRIGDNFYYCLCKICDQKMYNFFIFMAKKKMEDIPSIRAPNNITVRCNGLRLSKLESGTTLEKPKPVLKINNPSVSMIIH